MSTRAEREREWAIAAAAGKAALALWSQGHQPRTLELTPDAAKCITGMTAVEGRDGIMYLITDIGGLAVREGAANRVGAGEQWQSLSA